MTGNICSASLRVLANLLRMVSAITKQTTKGGFPVIAQTSRSHVFTKEIIMQVLGANILMGISIVKIVCECFLA